MDPRATTGVEEGMRRYHVVISNYDLIASADVLALSREQAVEKAMALFTPEQWATYCGVRGPAVIDVDLDSLLFQDTQERARALWSENQKWLSGRGHTYAYTIADEIDDVTAEGYMDQARGLY